MKNNKIINIAAISGSLKSTSSNTNILRAIVKIAPENVVVSLVEGLDRLPHFNPENEAEIEYLTNFRQQLKNADGIIFSTPEYAYGVPGVLKNALDWLVSSGELYHKPVAAISASPVFSGGEKALTSLLLTLSALGTNTNEASSLSIANIKNKMSESGEITDPGTLQSLKSVFDDLLARISTEY